MKRFHFSLRPVKIMRTHRELRSQQALAAALKAAAEAEAEWIEAEARREATAAGLASSRNGSFRAGDQAFLGAWLRRESAAADAAGQRLAASRTEAGRRRDECVEARRQLKIVTRLEERARAVHRGACLAAEQQQLDECAGQRSIKKKAWL